MEWLRIGDVARRTGLTHRTLRHYDELGLLVPGGRSDGGYRLYSGADLERLLAIQHLKSLGMGLEEIGRALDDPAFDAAEALRRHAALVERRIADEADLLARLRRLERSADAGWEDVVDAIALSEKLRHPDAAVRFRTVLDAGRALEVDDLVEAIRDEHEPGVREVLTWALAQHGGAAVIPVATLADADDADVRHQVAHVLGKVADAGALGTVRELLRDADARVAAKAAFALGRIGGSDAVAALTGVLGQGAVVRRVAAVDALGVLGADAVPALVGALASPAPEVRADAADALGLIGSVDGVAALAVAAADRESDVAVAALMALAAIGADEARAAIAAHARAPGRPGLVARRLSRGDGHDG